MGRVRGTRGPAAALLAALLVAALGGCGSEEAGGSTGGTDEAAEATPAGDSEESPTEEPSEEAAPVAIERGPFCDRVDGDVVEAALGGPARWKDSRKPGDKFQVSIGNEQVEENFYCRWQTNAEGTDYGEGEATLAITLKGRPTSAAQGEKQIADTRVVDEQLYETCEEMEVPFASDLSYARVCDSPGDRYNQPRSSGSVMALFGDVWLTCFVDQPGKKQTADAAAALEDACYAVPEALAS